MDKFKDLQQTFSTMRLVTLSSLGVAALSVVAAVAMGVHAYGSVGRKVYVVGQSGTSQMAMADSPENHTAYEMRNLVRNFAVNMYGHDQYTYKTNLNTALPLIDDLGGRRIYTDFKRQDVLGTYVKFGARTTVTVDSIILNTAELPVRGKLYMRQTGFLGDRQSKSQPMGCSFELTNTYRSDKNPFGMMLTHFDYFPYNAGISNAEKRTLEKQAERDAAELAAAKEAADAAAGKTPAQ
jgi:hypothetical protein